MKVIPYHSLNKKNFLSVSAMVLFYFLTYLVLPVETSETNLVIVRPPTIEICNNSIDDDGDGLVDCEDPDCNLNGFGANWYFGQNAGLNFENAAGPIQISPSSMNTDEGCAVMSDENGDLMFYTNGVSIWNANHTVMPNGSGLLGNPSSTQSGVTLPDPSNPNRYYVISLDHMNSNAYYSVLDMTLDSGNGDVVVGIKNVNIAGTYVEKIAAWPHSNGTDYWLILVSSSNELRAYQLTTSGFLPPVITNLSVQDRTFGQMKFNADGYLIALACYPISGSSYNIELYNFDKATGLVSNPRIFAQTEPYGLEFSPSGQLLYATEFGWSSPGKLYQYQITDTMTAAEILASQTLVLTASNHYYFGSLQMGPDKKIYIASSLPTNHVPRNGLSVINDPDSLGFLCNPVEDQITFTGGAMSRSGLPNFPLFQVLNSTPIISYVATFDSCVGVAQLEAYSANANNYEWFLNGTLISGATDSTYTPLEIGDYQVVAYFNCSSDTSDVFSGPMSCPEICGDALDNDGDGNIDCLDPDCPCNSPFNCSNELYQYYRLSQSPDVWTLSTYDVSTSNYLSLFSGDASAGFFQLNGIGYNTVDNLIYGSRIATMASGDRGFYSLNANGTFTLIISLPENLYAGDITNTGVWFGFDGTNTGNTIYVINTQAATPIVDVFTVSGTPFLGTADMVFNESDGLFYGVNSNATTLVIYNPITNSVTTQILTGDLPNDGGGATGALWINSTGTIYGHKNNTGNIYEVNIGTLITTHVGIGPIGLQQNDGASCRGASIFLEICNDGLDNDGDGNIDRLDDDCCQSQAPTLMKN